MAKRKSKKSKKSYYLPALKTAGMEIPKRGFRPVQAFVNSDLRPMLPGLKKILEKNGINVKDLQPGQCIPFLNTNRDYIKVIVGNGTEEPILACKRLVRGRRMPIEGLIDIYHSFRNDGGMHANSTLTNCLKKYSKDKYETRTRDVTPTDD